ncbi:hypothetical protein FNV43_RR26282 [Rhamnella rubrinervis]|uniref:Nodulin-related protein 1 n=1 Tax=Rhamnella rubrinervis TaxID=2594499 RepID=A0A8K0DMN7_9ROSA|nr:hypothetical protein FNV43_RR26282 [Rhamnella rubrinervis]
MDFLKSQLENQTTGDGDGGGHKKPAADKHTHGGHKPASSGELLSSAKLVAEAAKSTFRNGSDKVDKGKVAGATANLLDAASHYGKLEEKSFGKYVEKAENYLHHYHTTTTVSSGGHSVNAPPTKTHDSTATAALPHEGGGGDVGSESKYGEYFKMAQGFLKK